MAPSNNFDVAIAGAGPAGASAAIRLAMRGAQVLLVEEKKFPRAKLCGEFISPECLAHFKHLGVLKQMISIGGALLSETVFYSCGGRSVAVPSTWFSFGASALGLSRSEMDYALLERAKNVGVKVLEESHASLLIGEQGQVRGIRVRMAEAAPGFETDFTALVTIDATGRTRALARHVDLENGREKKKEKPRLVAFKAHLEDARVAGGVCEIYFYSGGYGGLTGIEGGLSNLCFIASAKDVRKYHSDPETVLREVVKKNARAAYTLAQARPRPPWLSVSLDGFGRKSLTPAAGLLTVGDAASFIDPFTGSGMLMALESGRVAAETIAHHLAQLRHGKGLESVATDYRTEYSKNFHSRLRVSGLLRRAAFVPGLAETAIVLSGASSHLRRKLARATRNSGRSELRSPTS